MNLDDVIVPGESAGGIRLGQRINQVLAVEGSVEAERFHGIEKYVFAAVTLWVRDGLITQIGVRSPYSGKLAQGIGIGSTIGEVESAIGRIGQDASDNLVVLTSPDGASRPKSGSAESLRARIGRPGSPRSTSSRQEGEGAVWSG